MKRLTKEEFIERARAQHGDKYIYDKAVYINNQTKVIITCPKHGDFLQTPCNHIKGRGCPACGREKISRLRSFTLDDFIKKARGIHGLTYDYSKVTFIDTQTKVIITCPIHGDFEQRPNDHTTGGCGCPTCGHVTRGRNSLYSTSDFIRKSTKVHNGKYSYHRTRYKSSTSFVIITCPVHGDFKQRASYHLNGAGCKQCANEKLSKEKTYSTAEFIKLAKQVHDHYYIYKKTKYTGSQDCVIITCPQHGDFSQKASNHLMGNGCPHCQKSKGENRIATILNKLGIKYERQRRFNKCKDTFPLPFDFYFKIDRQKFLIEYDGEHHFISIERWGGLEYLEDVQRKDAKKTKFAEDNGFVLIRIKYTVSDIEAYLLSELNSYLTNSVSLSLTLF